MATHGGKREGAGRPAGSSSKKRKELWQTAEALGVNPAEVLLKIAAGNPIKCRISFNYETGDFVEGEMIPTLPEIQKAATDVMPYMFTKLKAVEHSTIDENGDAKGIAVMLIPAKGDSDHT